MAEARRKRQETKERRLRERAERKAAWAERKTREIGYLGDGVSSGLGDHASDAGKLRALGIPVVATAAELAAAMKIEVGELRFLAYARSTSRVTHYVRFEIPKRTGGTRLISAPMPRLKAAQHWVLRNILDPLDCHDAAHGFRLQRSIVSNAEPHVGADVVVNVDLKDFFPSVDYKRVKGVFRGLGYGEEVAILLALLCTEPQVVTVELDGERYHVAISDRALPQGAPTSPAITNRLCRRLDARLAGAARSHGFRYTRYADDLSFSARGDGARRVGKMLAQAKYIAEDEGFTIHEKKTRVFRKGRRQEVTGLVVNDRVSVNRETLRRFRATLFQIEKDGPEGKHWGQCDDVASAVFGFANFVCMVDPERGAPLRKRALAIYERYGPKPRPRPPSAGSDGPEAEETTQEAEQGRKKKKKWWKLF
jgi:retron-type reverse transcriptase